MKHLARTFAVLGFIFQYLIPIALLSTVVALTHGGKKAGLTVAGILCLCVLVIIILGKLKNRILLMKNQITKQALLSISPLVIWAVGYFAIKYLSSAIGDISGYWLKIAPFILIGRGLYITSGVFKNEQTEKEEAEKEQAIIEKVKGELNG